VALLQADDPLLQKDAAWILTNIAAGPHDCSLAVADAGAIAPLAALVASQSADVRTLAVWALSNLAGDGVELRDRVLACGVLPRLVAQLEAGDQTQEFMREAAHALLCLADGKPVPAFDLIAPALPVLAQRLVLHDDVDAATAALEALVCVCAGVADPEEHLRLQAVLDTGVLPRLVALLARPSPTVQRGTLRVIGSIAAGDDVQTQAVLDTPGVAAGLLLALASPFAAVRREAAWTASNIAAGTPAQVQWVLDAGVIAAAIRLLGKEPDADVRLNAAFTVCNATSRATVPQITALVQLGCLPPLAALLEPEGNDPNAVHGDPAFVSMEALHFILKAGDVAAAARGGGANAFVPLAAAAGVKARLAAICQGKPKCRKKLSWAMRLMRHYFDAYDGEREETAAAGGDSDSDSVTSQAEASRVTPVPANGGAGMIANGSGGSGAGMAQQLHGLSLNSAGHGDDGESLSEQAPGRLRFRREGAEYDS
jgi:hypothetical protein